MGFSCHVSCVLENENTTIQGKFSSQRIHRAARMIETYGGNPAVKQSFPFSYFMLPKAKVKVLFCFIGLRLSISSGTFSFRDEKADAKMMT